MLNQILILFLVFTISGCVSQKGFISTYPSYNQQAPTNYNSSDIAIPYAYEFIVKDDKGNPINDASIDYVFTEKIYGDAGLDIEKGKLITDSNGTASRIFNPEKDRFNYTFFPNSIGKQFPKKYAVTYKVEKSGFRPIISVDELSLTSTKPNQLRNEILQKIIPPSQVIKTNLTFNIDRLPKHYTGADIIQLKNELIQEGMGTSEEDTLGGNWYDAKKLTDITRTKAKKINDADAAKNVYAFKLEDEWIGHNSSISPRNFTDIRLNANKMKFIIKDSGTKRRKYMGSNVFGVTVKVSESSEVQYTIKPINLGNSLNQLKLSINIPPDDYAKKNIGALFICKPFRWNNCYVTTSGGGVSPTISSPSAYYHAIFNVNVELYEVWIYNQETGEIYLKYKIA